jgi:ubiquinone/menaquinone biosynthesis C-methylase UbiE
MLRCPCDRSVPLSLYRDIIFPHLLERASRHFDDERRVLLPRSYGRVLELGVGTGANLRFYPPAVTDLVAIDPVANMIERAAREVRRLEGRRRGLPFRVRLHQASAEALPYADGSFDTVVAFLTLCTVPDPAAAAREVHRVLRPGGRLLVLEHVRAEDGRPLAWWQDRVDPLWTRAAGGCHLNRDTPVVLENAGFDTAPLHRYRDQTYFPFAAPRIRGELRRPEGSPGR